MTNNPCGALLFGLIVLGVWWATRGPEVQEELRKLNNQPVGTGRTGEGPVTFH